MAKIGVECAHGFGDCCFNLPLIRELSRRYASAVTVAVRPHCADAFENIPWIGDVVRIQGLGQGERALRARGCEHTYQLTQNIHFYAHRERDSNHSLIDTPLWTGRQIGIPDFDQRPIFIPTHAEIASVAKLGGQPTIAVESVYTSGQSWADATAFRSIVAKYQPTHKILWLSNAGAPPGVDDMLRFTRRQCIAALRHCETLFCVGSGMFCAMLGLPPEHRPARVVCLWKDELYKYEGRLAELGWYPNIEWVHSHEELVTALHKT